MAETEKTESGGTSVGWIAAIAAAIAGILGIVGYQAGWFDRLFGKETKINETKINETNVNTEPQEKSRLEDGIKFATLSFAARDYESNIGVYPKNICDASGKPLLSWRVELLPYIGGEGPELYKQFKKDEPWNSEHNKKLIAQMPAIFAIAGSKATDGMTTVQGLESKAEASPRPIFVQGNEKGLRVTGIEDGTSNTIFIAEATQAVEWTKPQDLKFSAGGPIPKIGGVSEKLALVGMADGSIRAIPQTISIKDFSAIATANGEEPVNQDVLLGVPDGLPKPLKPGLGR